MALLATLPGSRWWSRAAATSCTSPAVPDLHVLRVFCADAGTGGNPHGVFLDGREVAERDRQPFATDIGFAETVYVDDPATGDVRVFTPGEELDFTRGEAAQVEAEVTSSV